MLDYFKKNPSALMDAIPTPPGEQEDEEALKDFKTGLTPMRGKSFKFTGNNRIVNRFGYDNGITHKKVEAFRGSNTSHMSARSLNSSRQNIY